jgi:hypothetical protein
MSKLRSLAAQELATQLRYVLAREKFTEARLFVSYINPALPHRGTLALYSKPSREDLYDNIFQGDVTEMEFDLNSMGHARTNKRFINNLIESVSPHWRYLSNRRSFGFDKEGFDDVSARFDIEDLKKALPGQWAM